MVPPSAGESRTADGGMAEGIRTEGSNSEESNGGERMEYHV